MVRSPHSSVTAWLLLAALLLAPLRAQAPEPLVRIGAPGGGNAGFQFAPGGYRSFRDDAVFVAGRSSPAADWPYVHPGPQDGWAGGRAHCFRVVFDVASVPPGAVGEFELGTLDAHAQLPPEVRIALDGVDLGHERLPAGAGDRSVHGEPAAGRRHTLRFAVPAGTVRPGRNVLTITSGDGSWFLYEYLTLQVPGAKAAPIGDAAVLAAGRAAPGIVEHDGRLWQPLVLDVVVVGGARPVVVRADGAEVARAELPPGRHELPCEIPAVERPRTVPLEVDGQTLPLAVRAVPKLTIFVVPHSHTDIGYTHLQAEIETRQVDNLVQGMAHAERTADRPEGARFVWNVEVLWAADLFLQRASAAQREQFARMVRSGQVALHGLYLNVLSGLMRPEELVQCTRLATRLAAETGVPIDTAMISDVPGHAWGLVPALAHAGIRYLSTSPNFFDRIGTAQVASADQPFWWISPSGAERVLVWNTWMGYALSHRFGGKLTNECLEGYLDHLAAIGYPHDVTYVRWSGLGDNAPPEASVSDFVQQWNERYRWPRLVISAQRTPFVELERRCGERLPTRRGDWTPYWEDGAGSSARETAMNRASADRLVTAEALMALRAPGAWSAAEFAAAWQRVLLYSEHTWGAWNSVSAPAEPFVQAQWEVKRGYAEDADARSRSLLAAASAGGGAAPASAIDVWNPTSWPRTGLVRVPPELARAGDRVLGPDDRPVPSQRLQTGELAVLVRDLPPFAGRRLRVVAGAPAAPDTPARADGSRLQNGAVAVALDPQTGDVASLTAAAAPGEFVDTSGGQQLGRYLFFAGADSAHPQTSGEASIAVGEPGPLVASLRAESSAPGTAGLVREVVLEAGADHALLRMALDKQRAPAGPRGDCLGAPSKESLSVAFPFRVPGGEVRLELPLAGTIRPDRDQIEGSCKNWFSIGDWADVAAADRGVQWVSLDTPLVQLGGLTANLLNSQPDPAVWRKSVAPTQALFAWLANNHWGTNYRAWQEGPLAFRFVLRPHGAFDAAAAARFAIGLRQPLLALPPAAVPPTGRPRLSLSTDRVVVLALKPADDGPGLVLRLQNVSEREQAVRIDQAEPAPAHVWRSATDESRGAEVGGSFVIPAWGLVTLRVEFAR